MRPKQIALGTIRLDGDTQPRQAIDQEIINDYAGIYAVDPKQLPPLIVFFDGVDHWLVDGFHRWHAARKVDLEKAPCEVHKGTLEEARWYACSVNQTHGLRRTNPDKQKAVKAALRHPKGAKMSDTQIAEYVGVAVNTVCKYRRDLESTMQIAESPTRTGRDGRTTDTSNVGQSVKTPDPKAQPKKYAQFASARGDSLRQIAAATGKSHEAIRKWLKPKKVDSKLTVEEPEAATESEPESPPEKPTPDPSFGDAVKSALVALVKKHKPADCLVVSVLENIAEGYKPK